MDFLKKAYDLMPVIRESIARPVSGIPEGRTMRDGDSFMLDFGTHVVGYITLAVNVEKPGGDTADSPLAVEFKFYENLCEDTEEVYTGGMSRSWFQVQTVFADNPYEPLELPRRYAFRYVKITFPANTSYAVSYKDCFVRTVTSADDSKPAPLPAGTDPLLKEIDRVALLTLKNCMQTVFEDGPKRDRRLWLGDLYLQAKTNYCTFKNNDLVLRCLYLFAGLPHEDGCLSSAVFQEPVLRGQSWILHDYALFFAGVLADYFRAAGRKDVVEELWPVAFRQTEIAFEGFEKEGRRAPVNMYFIDWCPSLDKSCAALGILVFMLKEALYLAEIAGTEAQKETLRREIETVSEALAAMYDPSEKLFCTSSGQLSVHSQMWAVLAGVLDPAENASVMGETLRRKDLVSPVTPYAMHYFIDALIRSGLKDEAFHLIKEYWGGMLAKGCDCFPEVFVPGHPDASPYGSVAMNSYCHAWSCTPAYFIRTFGW